MFPNTWEGGREDIFDAQSIQLLTYICFPTLGKKEEKTFIIQLMALICIPTLGKRKEILGKLKKNLI